MRNPCVYILASRRNGTLYVGVTSDIARRVWQHKNDQIDGFTKKYGGKLLVYVEMHATMPDAILREKQIKEWRRAWKLALVERANPQWRDLYPDIAGAAQPPPANSGDALDPGFRRGDEDALDRGFRRGDGDA